MHLHRPGTDQHIELTVLINNEPATEYVAADSDSTPVDGYIDTYIPVSPSDRISVNARVDGTMLHGHCDLVVDGTLVNQNRIEGNSNTGALRHVKKAIKWPYGFDCPTPEGWTSIESPKDCFEVNLIVTEQEDIAGDEGGGDRPGVGSVVFVASFNTNTRDWYHDPEQSIEMGTWRARKGEPVRLGDIDPEYGIELRLLEDDKINGKRASTHRKHWQATRFGKEPWVKCCFYYRSLGKILEQGMVVRGKDDVCMVKAWNGDDPFPAKEYVKKTRGKKEQPEDDEDLPLFVSQDSPERKIKQESMSPKPKPKKRLGGPLFANDPPAASAPMPKSYKHMRTPTPEWYHQSLIKKNVGVEPTIPVASPDSGREPPLSASWSEYDNYFTQRTAAPSEASGSSGLFVSPSLAENFATGLAANNTNTDTAMTDQNLDTALHNENLDAAASTDDNIGTVIKDDASAAPNWNFPTSSPTPAQPKSREASAAPTEAANLIEANFHSQSPPPAATPLPPSQSSPQPPPQPQPSTMNSPAEKTSTPAINTFIINGMATEGMDSIIVPTVTEIRSSIRPSGLPMQEMENLFRDNGIASGPYTNQTLARAFFLKRVEEHAELKGDGKYYLLPLKDDEKDGDKAADKADDQDENNTGDEIVVAQKKRKTEVESDAEEKKTPRGKKQATKAKPKSKSKPKAKPAATRRPAKQDSLPASSPPSINRGTNIEPQGSPSPAPPAALKRKAAPTAATGTPKRARKEGSATPAATVEKANARKSKLAKLKADLASKLAKQKEVEDRVKKEEEEIAELERLNAEADERLRELEGDGEESEGESDSE